MKEDRFKNIGHSLTEMHEDGKKFVLMENTFGGNERQYRGWLNIYIQGRNVGQTANAISSYENRCKNLVPFVDQYFDGNPNLLQNFPGMNKNIAYALSATRTMRDHESTIFDVINGTVSMNEHHIRKLFDQSKQPELLSDIQEIPEPEPQVDSYIEMLERHQIEINAMFDEMIKEYKTVRDNDDDN